MNFMGFDIGGANIKMSDGRQYSCHEPFALWRNPEDLTGKLRSLLKQSPPANMLAITMTGELTDCFANKKQGVEFIVDAVCTATDLPVRFYLVDGRFVDSEMAKRNYGLAAASNWHGLASLVSKEVSERRCGMLIDIGSTTADLIPFADGQVIAQGRDDFGRLTHHELVYTGAIRSPLCGITGHLLHRGRRCAVMNEMFATTLDTNIILGHIAPGTCEFYAADGQSTSIEACLRRLSRMIGKDDLTFDLEDGREISMQVFESQVGQLTEAARLVISEHDFDRFDLVLSGQGEFLGREVASRLESQMPGRVARQCLSSIPGDGLSDCATAWCIARLASQVLQSAAAPTATSQK